MREDFSTPMPKIAAVVLNWNGRHFLRECFDSIEPLKNDDLEVILVDNGSTDGSVPFMKERYPWVRLVENKRNMGFSAAVNAGIRATSASYVALLNNDIVLEKGWFQSLAACLDRRPDAGLCAAKMVLYHQRDVLDSAGNGFYLFSTYGIGFNSRDAAPFNLEKRVFGACAGAAMYRRTLFDAIGFFDEDFFLTHEDNDLCLRANLAAFRCYYVPSAVVYHHHSATVGEFTDFSVFYHVKNFFNLIVKDVPLSVLVRFMPHLFQTVAWRLLYHVLSGRALATTRAVAAFLGQFPKMLLKRIGIQATICVSGDEVRKIFTDVYR